MPKSLAERKAAAVRKLERVRAAEAQSQAVIDAAGELAELNAKTMTVAQSQQWADEFTRQHPSKDAIMWAGEFVGRVKAHHENPRGPKPEAAQQAPADVYDPIVLSARRRLGHQGFDLSPEELGTLSLLVNQICGPRMLPPINKRELRQILRRLKKQGGS